MIIYVYVLTVILKMSFKMPIHAEEKSTYCSGKLVSVIYCVRKDLDTWPYFRHNPKSVCTKVFYFYMTTQCKEIVECNFACLAGGRADDGCIYRRHKISNPKKSPKKS